MRGPASGTGGCRSVGTLGSPPPAPPDGGLRRRAGGGEHGPPVRGRPGLPRPRPGKLDGDKSYGHRRCRDDCRRRGIVPRLARRGVEPRDRLGRHRWKVERTHAWFGGFRRLVTRYERRDDIQLGLNLLAMCVITHRQWRRLC